MSDPILDNLTEAQLAAVTHRDGPLLVIAGAGSGKTRVVTRRLAWLIREGVRPSSILAMTFTNKAAKEMKQRVCSLIGESLTNLGTFHSCCARFLRQDASSLDCGLNSNFTIYDEEDSLSLLKTCLKQEGLSSTLGEKGVRRFISDCKNRQMTPLELVRGGDYQEFDRRLQDLERAVQAYDQALRRSNAVDFDDLLSLMVRLLRENETLRDIYNRRFRYILVDEYQDTNRIQYELIKLLGGETHNVHVTGDPDQSIYSWRGADYRNIMDFTEDYAGAKVIKLEQNYRSTKVILEASNLLISRNSWRYKKELWTDNPQGENILLRECPSADEEAIWICNRIQQLRLKNVPCHDIAVFYRTNMQSRPLEEAILRQGIPYQLVGGIRYYERREVKDFLAFLRLKTNECDEVALRRVLDCLKCGIGPKTLAKVIDTAARNFQTLFAYLCDENLKRDFRGQPKVLAFAEWCRQLRELPLAPVRQACEAVLDHSRLYEDAEKKYGEENLEDRKENLAALIARAQSFDEDNPDGDLSQFLEEISLVADIDSLDAGADSVSLMTLHSSKGLEFPYVFIAGLEQGLLPHSAANAHDFGYEEERRLFYVGLTRARRQVFLSYAAARFQYGKGTHRTEPSRFLFELPNDCVDVEGYWPVGMGDSASVQPSPQEENRTEPYLDYTGGDEYYEE